MTVAAVVPEYEVFMNQRNALAFFFFKQPSLDQNAEEGPFWFSVEGDRLLAGTEESHVIFEDVQQEIIDVARQRGAIVLMEFENQLPVRCTPCYLSEKL